MGQQHYQLYRQICYADINQPAHKSAMIGFTTKASCWPVMWWWYAVNSFWSPRWRTLVFLAHQLKFWFDEPCSRDILCSRNILCFIWRGTGPERCNASELKCRFRLCWGACGQEEVARKSWRTGPNNWLGEAYQWNLSVIIVCIEVLDNSQTGMKWSVIFVRVGTTSSSTTLLDNPVLRLNGSIAPVYEFQLNENRILFTVLCMMPVPIEVKNISFAVLVGQRRICACYMSLLYTDVTA